MKFTLLHLLQLSVLFLKFLLKVLSSLSLGRRTVEPATGAATPFSSGKGLEGVDERLTGTNASAGGIGWQGVDERLTGESPSSAGISWVSRRDCRY